MTCSRAGLQTVSAARTVTQQFQGIANTIDASVSMDFRGVPRPSPIQDFIKAFRGPVASQAAFPPNTPQQIIPTTETCPA